MNASRERGAAAVEFALILPLLMLFISGIVDGGRLYAQQTQANHVAFIAARSVSLSTTTTAASAVAAASDGTTYTVDSANTTSCAAGSTGIVKVTVTRSYTPAFFSMGLFSARTLTASGVAQCQG